MGVEEAAKCIPPPAGQPGGEDVAINTVFVTRKEGLRSNSTSTTSPTRSAARVDEEERNLGKEGLEDEEERDSHAPEGQLF